MTTIKFTIDKSLEMLVYEGHEIARRHAEWISEASGDRCKEASEGCPCCQAWKVQDEMNRLVEAMKPGGVKDF